MIKSVEQNLSKMIKIWNSYKILSLNLKSKRFLGSITKLLWFFLQGNRNNHKYHMIQLYFYIKQYFGTTTEGKLIQ